MKLLKKFCNRCDAYLTIENKWRDEALCLKCGPIVKKEREKKHAPKRRQSEKLWRLKNKNKVEKYRKKEKESKVHYKRKYNLSPDETNQLLENGCQVCGSKDKLVIDHCHKSGVVRGCLCHFCNVSLGFARDNPNVLRKLANYIEPFFEKRKIIRRQRLE